MSNISPGDVTRFPNGISTNQDVELLGQYGLQDPTQFSTFFDDFHNGFTVGSNGWTVTNVGTGTEVIADADNGILQLTNDVNDNDSIAIQRSKETFLFETGKKLFFKARLKISDATESQLIAGLQILDTTPFDVTDGVYFSKADGDATLKIFVEKDGTSSSEDVAELEDDTFVTIGFFYDGIDKVVAFVNNGAVVSVATTNLPDDEELTSSFFIENGEAVAKVMDLDYVFVSKER